MTEQLGILTVATGKAAEPLSFGSAVAILALALACLLLVAAWSLLQERRP